MRVVEKPGEFTERLEEARREAGAAFGNDAVFLERYIRRARHVEVQILGDRHGNLLHFYERDCSVQRRHQKVVEVAPAQCLSNDSARSSATPRSHRARGRLFQRRHGRIPAGCRHGKCYFIEVNPRIQVEHTVTEMVTGIDIVRRRS